MATEKIVKKSSANPITKSISFVFRSFHLTIFFVFIVGCLAGAVLVVNQILADSSSDSTYVSPISAGSIDEEALRRVQSLHTSTESATAPDLPTGRINPFNE